MPPVTRGAARTLSAVIRTTGRCRWITSCGSRRGVGEPLSSIPASTPKYPKSADAHSCAVPSRGSRRGIDANAVEDVILTHLHYDHVGNFDRFPKARFHLQERELAYATGRYMHYPRLSHSFEVEDVCGIVRLNYAGRVMFYNGDAELAPGLTVHAVGGHSAGLQFVRVRTRRGFVVLASDVTHFYENMASSRPFTTAFHIGEMLEGFDRLLALAPDESHIVPGHDPLVMKLYPAPSPQLEGIAVRLDVPPSGAAPVRADFRSQH
jgi:glyoxylase-like metal-dependent hydrolase (beta-lactamase superfamily II)